jgi:hypothetical protein
MYSPRILRSTWQQYQKGKRFITAILLVTCALVCMVFTIVKIPQIMIAHRHLPLTPKEQLDAEAAIRSSFIQMLGGAVLVSGLYFTARGFRLTREGHITDRYSKAIEQLGNENADVRVGGIYALERIMHDSANDRETIVDVLTTYIREHTKSGHRTPSPDKITADVQAALYVLGRRSNSDKELKRLDFYHSGLNDADLAGGDFRRAMFYYSLLDGATFSGAKLNDAGLSFCKARGAAFTDCVARHANFVNAIYVRGWFLAADLTGCDFYGCDLSGSDFGRRYAELGDPPLPPAIVTGARFTNAKLAGTILRGVDLSTVTGITPEQLREAVTDSNTTLPLRWRGPEDEEG